MSTTFEQDVVAETTVWVVKDCGYDLTAAERYGTPRFLITKCSNSPFATSKIAHELEERMKDVRPKDVLLFCGPPVMCAMALEMFRRVTGGAPVRVLLHHARRGQYIERAV